MPPHVNRGRPLVLLTARLPLSVTCEYRSGLRVPSVATDRKCPAGMSHSAYLTGAIPLVEAFWLLISHHWMLTLRELTLAMS